MTCTGRFRRTQMARRLLARALDRIVLQCEGKSLVAQSYGNIAGVLQIPDGEMLTARADAGRGHFGVGLATAKRFVAEAAHVLAERITAPGIVETAPSVLSLCHSPCLRSLTVTLSGLDRKFGDVFHEVLTLQTYCLVEPQASPL